MQHRRLSYRLLRTSVSINDTPVKYAQVNGVSLAYREFGSGEPVFLIQGFGNVMDQWHPTFLSTLSSKYHVYIYEHHGMGYSGDNDVTPTIQGYADDALGS